MAKSPKNTKGAARRQRLFDSYFYIYFINLGGAKWTFCGIYIAFQVFKMGKIITSKVLDRNPVRRATTSFVKEKPHPNLANLCDVRMGISRVCFGSSTASCQPSPSRR